MLQKHELQRKKKHLEKMWWTIWWDIVYLIQILLYKISSNGECQGKLSDTNASCKYYCCVWEILFRLILVGFGIAGLVVQTLNDLTDGRFFLIFSPIIMVYLIINK